MSREVSSLPEHIRNWAQKASEVAGDDTFGLLAVIVLWIIKLAD